MVHRNMNRPFASKTASIPGMFVRTILCAWLIVATALTVSAQEQKVSIKGDVPTVVELSLANLAKLPRSEVHIKDRDGKESVYSGVPLAEVLRAAGMNFDPGAMPSRAAVASYVLIEAADGYKAVFALSEIDPTQFYDSSSIGGVLISPDDKRPTRAVRQVVAISVHQG